MNKWIQLLNDINTVILIYGQMIGKHKNDENDKYGGRNQNYRSNMNIGHMIADTN